MSYKNDCFIKTLLREPTYKTPCWMMRQAGRYLPEYRATRAKAGNFMNLCMSPELATEVTLQPIDRFGFDAAILFSDILTIPDAMGLDLTFEEGKGPIFRKPLTTEAEIRNLRKVGMEEELGYVMDAVRMIVKELDNRVPLIGFSGSPWTLATYMLEGSTSKEYTKIRGLMYSNPALLHALLDQLADVVIDYLNAQIVNGVAAVQIFDTWGGLLSKECYKEFSLRYTHKIINGLIKTYKNQEIPSIIFTKNGGAWLSEQANVGANAVGLDWMTDLDHARALIGNKVVLQGNMDPAVLLSNPEIVRAEVKKVLDKFGVGGGHIFNLGHGIFPGIDPENVKAMVDAVRELSPAYH